MRRLKTPGLVEDMITARVAEALDALHELDMPSRAADALTLLANSATVRLS